MERQRTMLIAGRLRSSIRRRRLEAFSVGVGEAERLAETGGLAVDNADGEEFLSRAARSVARY